MTLIENGPLMANPDIVFREEEDGAFLFDPNTGELKCLNPMGSAIWLLCDGSQSFEQIEQEIIEQYPQTPREDVHHELRAFLQNMYDMGYIGYQLSEGLSPS